MNVLPERAATARVDRESRELTRRGYARTDKQKWSEDLPVENSAPEADRPEPIAADWGRTVGEAADLLRQQMCPVCSEGPWKSPLNHIAKKHGISRASAREACGLTTVESVIAPDLFTHLSAVHKELSTDRDMSAISRLRPPGAKRHWTTAGRQAVASNLEAFNETPEAASTRERAKENSKTPEARAKQGEALRAWHERHPMSEEEKAAFVARMQSPEAEAKRQAARRGEPS